MFGCPYANDMDATASSSRSSIDLKAREATRKQAAGLIQHMQPRRGLDPCDTAGPEATMRGARRTRISLVRGGRKRCSRAQQQADLVNDLSGIIAGDLSATNTPM